MAEPNHPVTASRLRAQRSRIANGSLHDRSVNGRSAAARRFRDALASLCELIGRPLAELSEVERSQARMAAGLIVASEAQQANLAAGKAVDTDAMVRAANTLSRLYDDLGLSPAALEARRQREDAAAREANARRMGVAMRKP